MSAEADRERAPRGFILHPTYRIVARQSEERRAVVHLYGVLESGEPFLVRDDREVPHFYVKATHRLDAAAEGARPLAATDLLTLRNEPVVRVEVPTPPETPQLRDRLHEIGVPTYEADVRFALRYLIDHDIRAATRIVGREESGSPPESSPADDRSRRRSIAPQRVFDNPTLTPVDFVPQLRVLSFDIETDRRGRVLAVALWGCGAAEVWLLGRRGESASSLPAAARPVEGEAELLRAFVRRVLELDPDVLTGWNVIQFDLTVLKRRAERLGVPFELGRAPGAVRLEPQSTRAGARATVTGRMVLDGPQLLRGAFIRMDDYSLNAVAQEILGEGKTLRGPDRVEEIWRTFREDRPRFVDYALTDARLVLEILERLQLVELAVQRSRLTGLPLDRIHASVAAFDFLYLTELGKRKRVGPTVGSEGPRRIHAGGGTVLRPLPGLHTNVLVFDFKSLYPSLIRTFQIDPLGYIPPGAMDEGEGEGEGESDDGDEGGEDPIVAPNGAAFQRSPGILTELLDPLFERREAAKRAGDKVASQAIKILMNSFYGVLGTSVCRFASSELANAITSFGREMLLFAKGAVEDRGLDVLYGDTDSLFVASGAQEPQAALRLGEELVRDLNQALDRHVLSRWKVESRLELELERLYLRLLLPEMRHGGGGASKRYAGLTEVDGRQELVFVGLEVVRRDWTELAHRVQRELYARLFGGRPVEKYLRSIAEELKEGCFDELLVYRKALRKSLDEYTETTPPHVAAARKRTRGARRRIAYVWTVAGPEPADERSSPYDYDHYLDKQVRPVAEPVLRVLELDFDEVVTGRRQLELF